MELIAHRINTLRELEALPLTVGVEVDLRDRGDRLVLQHDPFKEGEDFETFLQHYRHGTLILNVKSERIEERVIDLMHERRIANYFFLDSSFPMIMRLGRLGETNLALRFSEYEGLDTLRAMAGRAKWVWVDCFTKLPLTKAIAEELRKLGYKICLVSPELVGRANEINTYHSTLKSEGILIDAVCTKSQNFVDWQ